MTLGNAWPVVREFTPEDAAAFRALRLEALETNPEAFGAVAAEFRTRTPAEIEQDVRQSFDSAESLILGAFIGPAAVGMSALRRQTAPKRRHIAVIWGVYITPAWRGRGLSGRILDDLIAAARQMPGLEQLILAVIAENTIAQALYTGRGFITYGREPRAFKQNGGYSAELLMIKFLSPPDAMLPE